MAGIKLGNKKYTRDQIRGFYEWQMFGCLRHFPDENDAEDLAKAFAFSRPRANGFITFQTKYKGKRFFWIQGGESEEINPMECYMRTLPSSETKKRIRDLVFGKKDERKKPPLP